MEEDKLKPCPFCGSEAELHENDWCDPPMQSAYCTNPWDCGIRGREMPTEAEAIAAWNRRPQPPMEEDAIEAAKRKVERADRTRMHEHGPDCIDIARALLRRPEGREEVVEECERMAGQVGRQFCSGDGYVMGGPAAIVATICGAIRALKSPPPPPGK
jgi:Lar family restriction alleviation protein